jgi:hypothetical protein
MVMAGAMSRIGESTQYPDSAQGRAALRYAEHGWPVLPGSIWNGFRFFIPSSRLVTNGVRPAIARNLASTDVRTVARWWGADAGWVPSVLLRSGPAFTIVAMPAPLGRRVLDSAEFRGRRGPVGYRPDLHRAYFIVQAGQSETISNHTARHDVEVLSPGEWIPAPPTRLGDDAVVQWWCTPESVDWQPASLSRVDSAVRTVLAGRRLEEIRVSQ